MSTSSTAVDSYHLRVMVERLQQEGRSEREIVRAVEEADDRQASAPARRGSQRWPTRLLRDRGFDVVEMGTTSPLRDTTLVLDRSGHPQWAATIARVLGPAARSEARPDSSRYLDVTVLLGSAWRAPALPLDP